MDIVAHAGAVMRGVVTAEHRELRPLAHRHLRDEGHEVVGDAARILADAARGMSAHRVEVAQDADRPLGRGHGQIIEHVLDVPLGATVGVGGAGGEVFADGHAGRIAVDGGRGAEHQAARPGLFQAFQQHHGTADVVAVIGQRLGHRLAHGLEAGEVDGGVDRVLGQQTTQRVAVARIALHQGGAAAGNLGDAVHHLGRTVAEVVEDDHVMASGQQLHDGVGADVTGTAGHEESLFFHGRLFFQITRPATGGPDTRQGLSGPCMDLDDTARTMP